MKINSATAGFIKGLLLVVVLAVSSFLADQANLSGVLNPVLATLVAAAFSALESHLKTASGGATALFGAVKLK